MDTPSPKRHQPARTIKQYAGPKPKPKAKPKPVKPKTRGKSAAHAEPAPLHRFPEPINDAEGAGMPVTLFDPPMDHHPDPAPGWQKAIHRSLRRWVRYLDRKHWMMWAHGADPRLLGLAWDNLLFARRRLAEYEGKLRGRR